MSYLALDDRIFLIESVPPHVPLLDIDCPPRRPPFQKFCPPFQIFDLATLL